MARLIVTALSLSAALSVGTLAAAQTPDAPPKRSSLANGDCFRTRDMENHTVGGPKTLYVKVRPHKVYRIEMTNSCLAGKTGSDPLILKPTVASTMICSSLDLDISVSSGPPPAGFATPCLISGISRLTPAEVAAIPKKKRP
jgi:hypothetical protein